MDQVEHQFPLGAWFVVERRRDLCHAVLILQRQEFGTVRQPVAGTCGFSQFELSDHGEHGAPERQALMFHRNLEKRTTELGESFEDEAAGKNGIPGKVFVEDIVRKGNAFYSRYVFSVTDRFNAIDQMKPHAAAPL
jgi:hypothetical protein